MPSQGEAILQGCRPSWGNRGWGCNPSWGHLRLYLNVLTERTERDESLKHYSKIRISFTLFPNLSQAWQLVHLYCPKWSLSVHPSVQRSHLVGVVAEGGSFNQYNDDIIIIIILYWISYIVRMHRNLLSNCQHVAGFKIYGDAHLKTKSPTTSSIVQRARNWCRKSKDGECAGWICLINGVIDRGHKASVKHSRVYPITF